MWDESARTIRVGESQAWNPVETRFAMLLYRTLTAFVFGYLLQLIFKASFVHGAVSPRPITLTTPESALRVDSIYCNDLEGWTGYDGLDKGDCSKAISLFEKNMVRPRGSQEYEFLEREVPKITRFPLFITPEKFAYSEL